MDHTASELIGGARRAVVKIGSSLLIDPQSGGPDTARFAAIAAALAGWRTRGIETVLVSSGAVALGRRRLKLPAGKLPLDQKQAAAAAGQTALMIAWDRALEPHGLPAAQALLTFDDMTEVPQGVRLGGLVEAYTDSADGFKTIDFNADNSTGFDLTDLGARLRAEFDGPGVTHDDWRRGDGRLLHRQFGQDGRQDGRRPLQAVCRAEMEAAGLPRPARPPVCADQDDEDQGCHRAGSPYREAAWIIDPIDGTRAFLAGLPSWCVLIALADETGPILSVIDQPHIAERFYGSTGAAGRSAHLERGTQHLALKTRAARPLAEAIGETTDPYLFKGAEAEVFETVRTRARLMRYGLDAYGYAMDPLG